ncbi:MAG: D-2-hydroxyacid dehydrogenase [Acidobacteriaceae bacterium]|nr:D-2-hydroxyacid dehydrogenase [Acidobacteriaceae bacterium]
MGKPNLLVICPPDHYALRKLDAIRDSADIFVSNDIAELERHAPESDIVLFSGLTGASVPFEEIWRRGPNIEWVHSLATGVEKLLFPELIDSPVPVTNARGVFKRSLAEFAVMGMLYFSKRVRRLVENQRAHRWDEFAVDWVFGKVMGVVGYGEIGRECAVLAKALGVKIFAARRQPELSKADPIPDRIFATSELKAMLELSDVVLLAAPLTPETRHMIGDAEFGAMKSSAIVINVGRGPVIDEQALVRALREKRLHGAALDVFETEPLKPDHPFWEMDNVLISPHCTDRTRNPDWLELTMQCFIDNFNRYVRGEPLLNVVDKKAGY